MLIALIFIVSFVLLILAIYANSQKHSPNRNTNTRPVPRRNQRLDVYDENKMIRLSTSEEAILTKNEKSIADDKIRCPKCKSTQLSANKKGFSGVKAVGGAILAGPLGIAAGTIGSNKIKITCLNCGHVFKPGEGSN